MQTIQRWAVSLGLGGIVLGACSRSNNLALGRVEALVGGRTVVVTDCYRTSVPQPVEDTAARVYRFMPCRDADVSIRHDSLTVNGRGYGSVAVGDTVVVDHGVVHIVK